MLRTLASVAACSVLPLFLGACDERPPDRSARPRCFPQERHAESGTAAYPPGYTERGFDRFFANALQVVGDRVSHEAQGCVEGSRLVADLGVKDLTGTDRRRIEALAPSWVKVNLFETEYSMTELQEFGDRAQSALEDSGLHIYAAQSFYGTPGKVAIEVTTDWIGVHRLLSAVIPPDSFVVEEVGDFATF